MTLGRIATLSSLALAVAALVGFIATGSLAVGLLLLLAPLPAGAVYWWHSDRADWTVWELLHRGPDDLEADLDDALRSPLPPPRQNDGDFFVPGVPVLEVPPSFLSAPPPCDPSPLVSSPPSRPAQTLA